MSAPASPGPLPGAPARVAAQLVAGALAVLLLALELGRRRELELIRQVPTTEQRAAGLVEAARAVERADEQGFADGYEAGLAELGAIAPPAPGSSGSSDAAG